jgi:hypothetical protein
MSAADRPSNIFGAHKAANLAAAKFSPQNFY